MKILFITAAYPNEHNPTEAIFIKEHALAASLFNDVAVIYGRKNKKQKESYRFSISKEDGFLTLRFTYRKNFLQPHYFSAYVKGVLAAFEKLGRDERFVPQVIQANGFFTAPPAALLKKKTGIPFVVREGHDGYLLRSMSKQALKRALFMREAAVIMLASKTMQKGVESYGIGGRFELVPGTVNTKLFFPASDRNFDGKLKRILTVARLVSSKGIEDLLESLRMLKMKRNDFILRIAGEGEKATENNYKTIVKEYGLSSQVLFLGRKNREELAELMRISDFFVLPTRCEPFGNVFIEALASGLPIIVTKIAGVAEYFEDFNPGIFIPPRDTGLLTEGIDYMLDHHSEYNAEQLAVYAREKFGYETVGKRLTEIYRSVVK